MEYNVLVLCLCFDALRMSYQILIQHTEMLVRRGHSSPAVRETQRLILSCCTPESAVLCCKRSTAFCTSAHAEQMEKNTTSAFPASMKDREGCFFSSKTTCLNIARAIALFFFLLWKIPYDISPEGLLGKLAGM